MMKFLPTVLMLLYTTFSQAEIVDTYQFKTQADRTRAVELAKSLRCPQCQNQNLVESNSPIAYDLRLEVYKMVDDGKSDEQIVQTMTARFGDFVRYNPPLKWTTALLWGLPIGLLILAFGLMWRDTKKRVNVISSNPLSQSDNQPVAVNIQLDNSVSAVKSSRVFYLLVGLALIAIPLAYYFSLNRYDVVRQGVQEFAQKQQQLDTASAHQHNDDYILSLQQQLRQNPNNADIWLELGQAYVLNNEFEHALIAYSNAEKIKGSRPEILGLAATALYYQAGQRITPKVRQLIDTALAQDNNETASLSLLASDAFLTNDYATALKYWQKLLDSEGSQVKRRNIIDSMNMAETLLKAKQND